jgi:hypothetical protein
VQNSPFGPTVGQLGAGIFGIPFNAQTGQPNVGSNQVLTLQNGTFVPSTFSLTSNGFNPGNVNQNLAKPPEIFNGQSGYPVTLRSYADGSSVAFDNNNNVLYTIPAGSQAYTPQQLDQINANAMRSLNVNVETGTRFITNPNTGVVTAVGGTTAVISNGISQTLGAVGGVVAGKKVYETLAKTGLGKSFLGQIVAGGISAGATAGIYRATNNLLQPIVNTGVGAIGQVFDSATRSIRNLTSTWSGTGGYDPKNPTVNLTSKVENPDGSISYNYVDGTQRTLDLDGVQTVTKSGNNAGPGGFWRDEESYVATSPAGAPIVDRNFNSDQTVEADIQSANLSSYDVSSD